MNVYDQPPPKGLPDNLPQGETLLWQGGPDWKRLALDAFHIRKVLFYFAGLAVLQGVIRLVNGTSLGDAARPALWLIPLGLIAAGILAGIAWASARTTTYTLTNKRAVMRIGIALPVTLNIPFKQIDGASFAATGGTSGTICFRTTKESKLAYALLWPHAKPWAFKAPEPAFRNIPDAEAVASLAAKALGGQFAASQACQPAQPTLIAAE